jgi:putative ABC transport system permease protein
MLKNYFQVAFRILFRNKFYSLINIVGLAIGLSTCLTIYLVSSFELGYEHFQPDMNRIYRAVTDIRDHNIEYHKPLISFSEASYMRNHFTGIDQVAYFFNYYFKVSVTGKDGDTKIFPTPDPSKVVSDIILTEPAYFDIFKYEWLAGNPKTSLSSPFSVVLSENRARVYFGSMPLDEVIGRVITYNDSLRLAVTGIVEDYPKNTDFNFKEFISFSTIEHSFLNQRPYFPEVTDPSKWRWSDYGQAFVKLSKGIHEAQIVNQTPILLKLNMVNSLRGGGDQLYRTIHLQPLSNLHFNPEYGSDYYTIQSDVHTLYGLMGIAALILSIAAINFINLSTAQSIRRAKEIGIRKVLGSSKIALILQCLSETFVLVLLSIGISILIVRFMLNAFPAMVHEGVAIELLNPSLLLFLFSMTLITTIVAGFYPAMVLSYYLPAVSLRGAGSQISNRKSLLRKVLIVLQFTVSIIFIIGTIAIGKQIRYLLNKNLGFQKNAIINFFNSGKHRNEDDYLLADRIRLLPGVERVSVSAEPPETAFPRVGPLLCKDNGAFIQPQYLDADDEFVSLYGLKILTGRNFIAPKGRDSSTEFLINETCSKQLGFKKPENSIGHLIQEGFFRKTQFIPFRSGLVVGIVADFHSQPLNIPIGSICIAATKNRGGLISVRLSTHKKQLGDFKAEVKNIERVWKKFYPDEDFNYSFYDRTIAAFYSKEEKTGEIMNIAMVIAILISCIGLLGLVTFMAAQRTKEIGIRKVLGASVAAVAVMLAKEFIFLIIFAMVLASPIAYFLIHHWLQGFAYRANLSGWIFALAGVAAILIALLTVSYQAIRAARANPVASLRAE